MTNEEAIKILSQIRDILLKSNSWLPSTKNPIRESFGMAIKALTAQPVDEAYLIDWYISSVDDSDPVWTEAHIEELMNDFYLIPKGCIDG